MASTLTDGIQSLALSSGSKNESLSGLGKRHTALPCLQMRRLQFPGFSSRGRLGHAISSYHCLSTPQQVPSSGCIFKDAVFLTIPFLFLCQLLPISSSKRSNFHISQALQKFSTIV